LLSFRHIAVCGLLLFLTLKPLIDLALQVAGIDSEFCEYTEDKESKKKDLAKKKLKEHKFYTENWELSFTVPAMVVTTTFIRNYYPDIAFYSEYFIEVVPPPPEWIL